MMLHATTPHDAGDNPENDAARIEQLLRHGAHALLSTDEGGGGDGGGDGGGGEERGMAAEGIDQVWLGREPLPLRLAVSHGGCPVLLSCLFAFIIVCFHVCLCAHLLASVSTPPPAAGTHLPLP